MSDKLYHIEMARLDTFHSALVRTSFGLFFSINSILGLIMMVFYENESSKIGGRKFFTKISLWNIYYIAPIFTNYICLLLIQRLEKFLDILDMLSQNESTLIYQLSDRLGSSYVGVKVFSYILAVSLPIIVFFELGFSGQSALFVWYSYSPSLIINVYLCFNCYLIKHCYYHFHWINEALDATYVVETVKIVSRIEEKVSNVVTKINEANKVSFPLYMWIGTTTFQSVLYTHVINRLKGSSNTTLDYSLTYWAVLYLIGLCVFIYTSHYLHDEAGKVVDNLSRLGGKSEALAGAIMFQELHLAMRRVEVSAGGLFAVKFVILGKILFLSLTYISVFLQIDKFHE